MPDRRRFGHVNVVGGRTLLVGGRDFSVVYNTWRGFFSLYNYNFNCIFLIVHYVIFNWKVMYQNVALCLECSVYMCRKEGEKKGAMGTEQGG